jgi:Flp pilus assembly protein TadG
LGDAARSIGKRPMTKPPAHDRCRPAPLRDEAGQALTEFILALPILAVLLFGMVQFGSVFNEWVEVSTAARVGARTASVSRKSGDVDTKAAEAARASVSKLDEDDLDVDVTPAGSWAKGSPVTVRVSHPFEINILGVPLKSGTMSYEATARMQ